MLMNFIALQPGVPTRMHFTDHYYVEREIWDEGLGRLKWVKSLVFWVDELGALPEARTLSVLSTNLHDKLSPYLTDHKFTEYDFVITKQGEGYATIYNVEAIPRE